MMKKLLVKATKKSGMRFPMEGAPRRYIGVKPESISSSAYYRRAINDGDLEVVKRGEPKSEGEGK